VRTSETFTLNEINKRAEFAASFLTHDADGYQGKKYNLLFLLFFFFPLNLLLVRVMGKTGEPIANSVISVKVQHLHFSQQHTFNLQSNDKGIIRLGELKDISTISIDQKSWPIDNEWNAYSQSYHGVEGEDVLVPFLSSDKLTRSDIALFEKCSSGFIRDCFDKVKLEGGYLKLQGLTSGDYLLLIKKRNWSSNIKIVKGEKRYGYAFGQSRILRVFHDKPVQIESFNLGKKHLKVQIANATETTRVHILSSYFFPDFNSLSKFVSFTVPSETVQNISVPLSYYISGRDLGDEYRYILDRKYGAAMPGNTLTRPSLLINSCKYRMNSFLHSLLIHSLFCFRGGEEHIYVKTNSKARNTICCKKFGKYWRKPSTACCNVICCSSWRWWVWRCRWYACGCLWIVVCEY